MRTPSVLAAGAGLVLAAAAVSGCAMNPPAVDTAGRSDITAAPPTVAATSDPPSPTPSPTEDLRLSGSPTPTKSATPSAPPSEAPTDPVDADWVPLTDKPTGITFQLPSAVPPRSTQGLSGSGRARGYTNPIGATTALSVYVSDVPQAPTYAQLARYQAGLTQAIGAMTGAKASAPTSTRLDVEAHRALDTVTLLTTPNGGQVVFRTRLVDVGRTVVALTTVATGKHPSIADEAESQALQDKLVGSLALP